MDRIENELLRPCRRRSPWCGHRHRPANRPRRATASCRSTPAAPRPGRTPRAPSNGCHRRPPATSPSASNASPASRCSNRATTRSSRSTNDTSRQPVRTASAPSRVAHRLQQHAMQLAAMDGELRRVEAGVGAAQFAPHHLAEAVGVDQLARADAGAVQFRQQAECGQFLDRVRQRVDADAEFAQFAHLLEHGASDAGLMQRQRRRQAADPAAHDQHMHRITPRSPVIARSAATRQSPPVTA